MWNMNNHSFPRRRKDFAQGQPLRGYARRRPSPGNTTFDEMWAAAQASAEAEDDLFGLPSFPPSRPVEPDESSLLSRSRPSRNPISPNPYAKDFSRRYCGNADTRVPFDQAARDLVDTTYETYRVCERTIKTFEDEVQSISNYANPRLVDALWKMKLECDSVAEVETLRGGSAGLITYQTVMQDFTKALLGYKIAAPPDLDRLTSRGAKLNPEGLRMSIRRLTMIYQTIEELAKSVGTVRSIMPALAEELKDAHALLLELEDLWKPLKMGVADHRAKHATVESWDDGS